MITRENINILSNTYLEMEKTGGSYNNKKSGIEFLEKVIGDCSFLAIKGSDQVVDWIRNLVPLVGLVVSIVLFFTNNKLAAALVFIATTQIHIGFLFAAIEIKRHFKPSNRNIYVFGHSLGGGIARILSFMYPKNKVVNITCGAPRSFGIFSVFNLVIRFRRVLSIINKGDVVPHTPPIFLGYGSFEKKYKTSETVLVNGSRHKFPTYQKIISDIDSKYVT